VGGVRFNADLLAASDREWFRDTAADLAGRARAYARSTALFEAAGESYGVSAEATILQDLRAAAPTPFQAPRAGEVALRIPVARILGPLRAGGQATLSAARQTGALRLDAPLDLADVAVVIPEFALRGALYDGRTLRRVTWLGATLRTELGRRFGEWNHLIVPEVRWRLGWAGADPGVPDPRDELDAALPPGGIHQLDARVVSDLSGPGLSLRAEAGQGVHLALPGVPARAAEGWLAASADWIWGRADGELRGDGQALRLAVARAALTLRDPRGDEWRGTAFYVAPGASDRARAPLDSLFALSAPTVAPPVTQLAAGATAVIANGLSARYDLLWVPGGQLQHAAAIRYDSPCGCAAASLTLNWISGESVPRLGVLLDLKQLGSIGAGG
jgi:hypothetical protein